VLPSVTIDPEPKGLPSVTIDPEPKGLPSVTIEELASGVRHAARSGYPAYSEQTLSSAPDEIMRGVLLRGMVPVLLAAAPARDRDQLQALATKQLELMPHSKLVEMVKEMFDQEEQPAKDVYSIELSLERYDKHRESGGQVRH
jgi:hypothetical protein